MHHYVKWVTFREKFEETNVEREAMIKEIAEFLKKVLPKYALHHRTPFPRQRVLSKLKMMKAKLKKKQQTVLVGSIMVWTRLFLQCACSIHDTVSGEKAII